MKNARVAVVVGIAAAMMAISLWSPVGAHVGGTVGHLWRQHLLPLARDAFFTKAGANERFVAHGEQTRTFVWRADNTVDTPLEPIFAAWDLEFSASCVSGTIHAEVDAVSEHGSIVGGFIDNFGASNLIRNTDWDVSSGPVDLNGGSDFSEAGGYFTYTSVAGDVVSVQYELSDSANDEGIECLVSGSVQRVA